VRAVDVIAKKRDGLALSRDEIDWFIEAYTAGNLPDYQAAALLMAICIQGMSRDEVGWLTQSMARSGEMLKLSRVLGSYAVDKHSSGGVGDKTTLVVLPLVAACGVPVAKMSGRGLGYSGGTLDKLEAIAGYRVDLTNEEFERLARENGIVLAGQSRQLAPADGMLYALRDVTATVPSLPLIASSIMSKKIAAGADGIVLDVKVGEGAFMARVDDARQLAQMMVDIGVDAGRDVIAVISDMNQPLGCAVGNALEVAEAIETLTGNGPQDFRDHCLQIAAHMLRLAGQGQRWADEEEVHALLVSCLKDGQALARFRSMVAAQGGNVRMVDEPSRLPQANYVEKLTAERAGYVSWVSALKIAKAAFELGAGREKKGDPIDLAVGVKVHVKVGDYVGRGDVVLTVYANDEKRMADCRQQLTEAISYSDEPVEPLPLFHDVIYGQ
jgi:pyrimidine-nucleoside phosphorylase